VTCCTGRRLGRESHSQRTRSLRKLDHGGSLGVRCAQPGNGHLSDRGDIHSNIDNRRCSSLLSGSVAPSVRTASPQAAQPLRPSESLDKSTRKPDWSGGARKMRKHDAPSKCGTRDSLVRPQVLKQHNRFDPVFWSQRGRKLFGGTLRLADDDRFRSLRWLAPT
jgi:hypothetical protein